MNHKLRSLQRKWASGLATDSELFNAYRRNGLICVETHETRIDAERICNAIGRVKIQRSMLVEETDDIRLFSASAYHSETYCSCEDDCERCEEGHANGTVNSHECCGACFETYCETCTRPIEDWVICVPGWGSEFCEACFWHNLTWEHWRSAIYP